jgi:uncharacterized protein (DUF885 family)
MKSVDEIADRYLVLAAELDPAAATEAGIGGYDDRLPDLSPAGFAARADLGRATIAELDGTAAGGERERVARAALLERLGVAVEQYEAGDTASEINVIASWIQGIREVFDLMPSDGEEAQHNLARRIAAVPAAYQGLRQTYAEAAGRGAVAPRRQVAECARQCAGWSAPGRGFYAGLVARTGASGALLADLERAAGTAAAATGELGRFLETELLPLAPDRDAAGRDRYARASRAFLGAVIDLDEAYEWGWSEVRRIEAEMAVTADRIVPGGTLPDAVAALEADPARRISGRENLRSWMQDYADSIMTALHGTHFDIPEPARRIEAMIAPVNGGGIYYSGPSEDWSRPGRMWWSPPDGIEEFSTWQEISTIHHEGVPGHHLRRSQRGTSERTGSTAGSARCRSSPATARAGPCTPNGSWTSWATSMTPATGSGCSTSSCCTPRRSSSTSACTWSCPYRRAPAGTTVRPGTPSWPGSSCARIPATQTPSCDSSWTGTWAGPVRPRPTSSASGSGCRPGKMPASARAPALT